MWVQSLCQEDPPEEGLATHSRIFAWRIPWTEEPGGLWSIELQRDRDSGSDLMFACTHTHEVGCLSTLGTLKSGVSCFPLILIAENLQ